jgi:formate hydrogenlyase subunit 4
MTVPGLLVALAQAILVGAGAPLLVGLIRLLKARLQGRRGASLFQPYRDLRKLLAKEVVVSETTSWIFRVTPFLLAAIMLVIAGGIPILVTRLPLAFAGNIVLVMYLLLLGTFFLALAGLDAGSAFGGMGASREVVVAALAEPTVILAIFALALHAGTTNLGGIIERLAGERLLALHPGHLLAFIAFFVVMIAETGRLPVDNPATHLELTMIHEAMVLEYSGRYLALIEWAGAMKLFLFLALLGNLFIPWGVPAAGAITAVSVGAIVLGVVALGIKLLALATLVAVLESTVAKLRLFRVPELLSGSFVLALLSVASFFFVR